ncbi:PREDICTED: spermidine synthase-like [Acropora digitifera]|uniref:spermidine synthase-like n=1 Tax=Acropora digitifera TaxID=70779 RepID=UPI00077ADA42|nr:PREDICTED: spermidine synthase-like [Acropora digitifera]
MNRIQNGWFSEINKQWPGQALSLEVEEVLFEGKSKYQDIIVFKRVDVVLIIGGGDGGVIREVIKHPAVESIVLCEIDEKVIEVSKKYLPKMACGFSSSKLTQFIGDGFEYMKEHVNEFDVIITDSSDPVGPAESLFQRGYYELMKKALKPDGILCCQGECLWLDLSLIKSMVDFSKDLFPVVNYGFTTIPTYPCGQIGFIMCSKNKVSLLFAEVFVVY